MKKETITVYSCCFCSKVSRHAPAMQRHESRCRKNPHTHSQCYDCAFYVQADKEEDVPTTYGEGEVEMFLLTPNRCTKRGIKLFNGLRWCKETLAQMKTNGNYMPMPSKADGCEFYEKRYND